ncbi:MAG: transcriptional regulator [Proteobacteria bacterium]|nr:transcriptional regulator [Pseudomonadota bacterium]
MNSTGSRIKEERERLNLTQAELGVAPKTQRYYESDERSPDAEYLTAFAAAGADVLYILTGRREEGVLTPREAVLLNNYRNATPERQLALDEIGAALPKRVMEKGVA